MSGTACPVPARTIFSTAGLPAARRTELWEDHNAAALIGLRCHPAGPDPLEATEVNIRAGQIDLAQVAGSAHVVERSGEIIRRSPADAIAVYITLRGDAWFETCDGTRALRPGHLLLCDADRPFARGFSRGLEELAIKVPRSAFAESIGLMSLRSPAIAGFGRGADPHARALAALVGRAVRAQRAIPADERAVAELVAVLATGRGTDPAIAHRAAARSFIEAHLPDPGLTASQVAAAVGISERHLSRVFAAGGTSLPRHVLSRRLQLAYALLTDLTGPRWTVAEVAAQCGFTSATYFSHVFREHFGQRAGGIQRQARAPQRPAPPAPSSAAVR